MIIGVPIFAILFAFMKSLIESRLTARNLSPETGKYLRLLYIDTGSKKYVDFPANVKKPFPEITKILVKGHEKKQVSKNDEKSQVKKSSED